MNNFKEKKEKLRHWKYYHTKPCTSLGEILDRVSKCSGGGS